jgi:signal transduction histidine kinase
MSTAYELKDVVPAIVWTVDRDLTFATSMGAGLATLSLEPGAVVGRSLYDYFGVSDPEFPPIAAHRKALEGQRVNFEMEWEDHVWETCVEPLQDTEGVVHGAVGVAVDVTDKRHLERRLRQAEKLESLGRLAGGVAHDFNNVLMGIQGCCEIIRGEVPAGSRAHDLLGQIAKTVQRGGSLTRRLLAFSRARPQRQEMVHLNETVSDATLLLENLLGDGIEMDVHLSAHSDLVEADAGLLEHALVNLVLNARDAMPDGGHVEVQTKSVSGPPGDWVELTVKDTGVGMDPLTVERAFEPFYTTAPESGSGLGLAMVYGTVTQAGGRITIETNAGQGTTVRVLLPRAAQTRLPQTPPPGPGDPDVREHMPGRRSPR